MPPDNQQIPNYDFIMNPAAPPPRRRFGGGSMASRLLIVVGGLFVLVVIAGIVINILGGGRGVDKAAMLGIAQDQTEIIRLSTQGSLNSVSDTNKNFSITAQLGTQTSRQQLLAYLTENGIKIKEKDLALKSSAQVDQQLTAATSASTFDEVYRGIMERQLQTYQNDLTAAYKDAGPHAKKVLSDNYDAAQLLMTQLTGKAPQD